MYIQETQKSKAGKVQRNHSEAYNSKPAENKVLENIMFDVIQNIIRIKIYNNIKAGKGVNGVKQFHGLIFWEAVPLFVRL